MATIPTNNPVPSESPRDLKFNAGKIDEFVTSLVNSYIDRLGNEHYTAKGLENLVRQIVSTLGFVPFGTFEAGATLTDATQALKYEADGNYYRWDGDFPKTVAASSTPSSTGGVGAGAWVNVTDLTLRSALGQDGGANLVNGSTAWKKSIVEPLVISIGLSINNGDMVWLSGRVYKVVGGSGIVASVTGNIVTLTDSSKIYLSDQGYGDGDVRAWGISPDNSAILNTELFQVAIDYCSGVNFSDRPTTVSKMQALVGVCDLNITIGFSCHPVKIYSTTNIRSSHGLKSTLDISKAINIIVDTPSKGCFVFDPTTLLDHAGQYFDGGSFDGVATLVTGTKSCESFVYSAFNIGMSIRRCRHVGAEFFFNLNDGWNFVLENNISNTTCGGIKGYRCTTGQVIGGYYNFLSPQTNEIGFDYVLASQIEASNRDISTKSVNKFSRGIHLLSSTVSFFGAIFEHWDLAHAQWGGGIDKNTSCYFEGIKNVIYAITQTSGVFKPLTINVLTNDNCRLIECNNTSGGGRDAIEVDLRGLTTSTSKLGKLGYSIYSGGRSRIIADNDSLSLLKFSFVNIYGTNIQYPVYIDTDEKPTLYVSQYGVNSASGTLGNPVKDLFSALAISSLFSYKDGVNIVVSGNVKYSDDNKVSVDVYVPVSIDGGSIDFSNSSDRISQIIGENIDISNCSILVSSSGVNRTYRNIFAPKVSANYKLKNVQLNIDSVFLIGDYTNSAKTVILRLENVIQSGSGGIVRNGIPSANEKILLTYIKQGASIAGNETGPNITIMGSVSI
ncbi:hypothetical protein [Pectobacterium versatile]|uniref:tail fiber/spike domain-containing protein n=1 Tax=Pectobacterium versatile TaxID=2488639 RepID=UPI0032EDBC10